MVLKFNTDGKEYIQRHAIEHIHELSNKLFSKYIHHTVMSIMMQDRYSIKPEDRVMNQRCSTNVIRMS
jgi:hypothetical protein